MPVVKVSSEQQIDVQQCFDRWMIKLGMQLVIEYKLYTIGGGYTGHKREAIRMYKLESSAGLSQTALQRAACPDLGKRKMVLCQGWWGTSDLSEKSLNRKSVRLMINFFIHPSIPLLR